MTSGTIDGVNEMILADGMEVNGKTHDVLVHFDRNGFAYTLDRDTGELLVAEKYDPAVNWATKVDMDKSGQTTAVRRSSPSTRPSRTARTVNTTGRLPGGARHQGPAAGGLFARRPGCSTCRPTTSAWTTSRSR